MILPSRPPFSSEISQLAIFDDPYGCPKSIPVLFGSFPIIVQKGISLLHFCIILCQWHLNLKQKYIVTVEPQQFTSTARLSRYIKIQSENI
jgi:hypothetical protein